MGAQAHWLLGYPDTGLALGREALELAERIAHPFTLGAALVMNALLHLDRNEPDMALQRVEAAEAIAAEQRIGLVLEPKILRGSVLTLQGALKDAVSCLRDGLTRAPALRLRHYGLALLAEALSRQGAHEEALATVRGGLADQKRTGERRWEPELNRCAGIALLGLNRVEEAQNALKAALRVARKQQAKSYELRTATTLARLWGEAGRRAEARELLAPVYGWFTQGFETADLKEAKALLRELA
jgi:tetratricopeptide (TPR) repeat protein